MGSTESRKETETNQNNVYMPNLLAKQIIGDPEEIYDGKKDKVKSNNSLIDKDNNQELILIKDNTTNEKEENNKSKEIVDIKNKKTFGNNIFSDINRGQYFNNQNLFISQTADAIKMEKTNQKKDIDYNIFL